MSFGALITASLVPYTSILSTRRQTSLQPVLITRWSHFVVFIRTTWDLKLMQRGKLLAAVCIAPD